MARTPPRETTYRHDTLHVGTPRVLRRSTYESITGSVHGEKVLRLLGIGFQLLAQAHEMRVHRARGRIVVITPDLFQQPIAAENFSGVADEVLEQLKLLRRDVDGLAGFENATALQIDLDVGKGVLVHVLGDDRRAPQNGLHARQQLANRERLSDV